MLVGTATSTRLNPAQAGRDAARGALEALGDHAPSLVLVHATAGYDQEVLLAAICDVTDDAPLVGCSGEGVISRDGSDESTHVVIVTAIAGPDLAVTTFACAEYARDEAGCGRAIAAAMEASPAWPDAQLALLFPDGLQGNCTALLQSLDAALSRPIPIAGGTAGDSGQFKRTYQYRGRQALSGAVCGALLGGAIDVDIAVSHGCEMIGLERRITACDGPHVLAIDGEPAWSVFRSYLDGDPDELRPLDLVHLCVAERIETKEGADAAAAEYGDMVIRTPLTVDKRRGSLFFPGGLREGTTVQLARRDAQRIHDSVIACGDELAARRPGQTPALVLQYDCTGRGRLVFGNRTSEKIVAPLRRALGHSAPWMGFHTYGEIAPLAAQTYYHNYTVVLCALYAQA